MKKTKFAAFTLIELLITVAIILLMAVLSVPAFNQYAANNEVSSKAEEIKSLLEKAFSSGMTPPQGANKIRIWVNPDNPSGTNRKVVIQAANSSVFAYVAYDPSIFSFPEEYVILPDYLFLTSPDKIYCEVESPDKFTCKNITRDTLPSDTLDLLTLSSNKSLFVYTITVLKSPLRVQMTKI